MPLEELKIHYPLLAMMCQNDRRKTGIITLNNMDVELTEFRGKDLYEDLLLRDITINSIY